MSDPQTTDLDSWMKAEKERLNKITAPSLNFHFDGAGHALILNPTRAGKSLLIGQAIAQSTKDEINDKQT